MANTNLPTTSDLHKAMRKAVDAAYRDWHSIAGEHDRKPGSVIDRMFIASGWSSVGVPKPANAKIPEWCGMAVVTWLIEGGLDSDFNTSFLHCLNVEAFFTYGRLRNVNPKRLDTLALIGDDWVKIKDWHAANVKPDRTMRRWLDRDSIRERLKVDGPAKMDLFAPGDVVLIDWSKRNDADHITMVAEWDGRTLVTLEGNRTGKGPDGVTRRDSVARCEYDLGRAGNVPLIYGVGRLSPLDLVQTDYK